MLDPHQLRPTYIQNGNWNRIDHRGNEHIYRVLGEEGDQIFVVQIGYRENEKFKLHPAPKTKSRRETWRRRTADEAFMKGDLYHIQERGIPPDMEADTAPAPGEDPQYDKRRAAVDYMVEKWGDNLLSNRLILIRAVKETASYFCSDVQSVRRWFETYCFFGRHQNALLTRNRDKGGPGIARRGNRDEFGNYVKYGRKPAKQLENPDGPDLRQYIRPELYRQYESFLTQAAWGTEDKFDAVYKRFVATRFAFNRNHETGERLIYQVKQCKLPSKAYMQQIGRKIFYDVRADRAEVRRTASHTRRKQTKGKTRDIVNDQIPVLDIDATAFDNRVHFPHLADHVDGHGKPTVLLAVDRWSGAITGWHVTFGAENANGYLACVFSAYTPKERELAHWGVPYLKGFVYGCAAKIFVDRGPGSSKQAEAAIVGRLKASMLIAAPYRPQGKGQVESEIGHVQRALSILPGSTFPSGNEEKDKQNKKDAKTQSVSLRAFMQDLLVAISRRNLEMQNKDILTNDMLQRKVIPCPADIYWYNKGRLRGDAAQAWLWPVEKVFRTLCERLPVKAPAGIVTIDGREYTSDALDSAAYRERTRYDRTIEIAVYKLPTTLSYVFWDQPNGNLGVLEATELTRKVFGDGTILTGKASKNARNSLAYDAAQQAKANEDGIIANKPGHISKAKAQKMKKVDDSAEFRPPIDPKKEAKKATKAIEEANLNILQPVLPVDKATPPPEPPRDIEVEDLFVFKPNHRLALEL